MYLCDLFVDSTIIPPPIEILRSLHTCWVGWDILPKVFREFSPRPNLILIPVNKSPREKNPNFCISMVLPTTFGKMTHPNVFCAFYRKHSMQNHSYLM